MIDQSKLLECMEEIKAIAVSQQGHLTKEEIRQYLQDMDLDETQLQAVYRYLGANQITVEGYEYVPEQETEPADPAAESSEEETAQPDAARKNLELYQSELKALEQVDGQDVLKRFLKGERMLRNAVIESRLAQVTKLADDYRDRKALIEDVIAEGNMGLMTAMQVLEQNADDFLGEDGEPLLSKAEQVIELEIKHAMENMIDDMTEQKDWEDTILAKTNLLHEAAKYMAEEMGRRATQEELSEYTKISVEEIRDIMGLSEDAKKVARPE